MPLPETDGGFHCTMPAQPQLTGYEQETLFSLSLRIYFKKIQTPNIKKTNEASF
jgi:hypothetical protein